MDEHTLFAGSEEDDDYSEQPMLERGREAMAAHSLSLGDLKLNEKWGADDNDLRVFRLLGKFLSGEAGYRVQTFPGFVRGCEQYRAVVQRGSIGNGLKAKTLLAVIMELEHVERLTPSQYVGSMAESKELGLEVLKTLVVPLLVEDLSRYAGWSGYEVPAFVENEHDHEKRKTLLMQYTKDWIMMNLAEDPHMMHYVQAIEDNALAELMGFQMAASIDRNPNKD